MQPPATSATRKVSTCPAPNAAPGWADAIPTTARPSTISHSFHICNWRMLTRNCASSGLSKVKSSVPWWTSRINCCMQGWMPLVQRAGVPEDHRQSQQAEAKREQRLEDLRVEIAAIGKLAQDIELQEAPQQSDISHAHAPVPE